MNAKKVLSFLVCSSAFTKHNIASVGLVLVFFLVYILAGGKIESKLPSARQAGTFGGVDANSLKSREVLGIVPTEDRAKREDAKQQQGRIFTNDEAVRAVKEPIDRDGLITGQAKVYGTDRERKLAEKREKIQRDEVDPLIALEERLRRSNR